MLLVLDSIELRLFPVLIYRNGELVEETTTFLKKHPIQVEVGDTIKIKRGNVIIQEIVVKEKEEVLIIRTPRVLTMIGIYAIAAFFIYLRVGDQLFTSSLGSYVLLGILITFISGILILKYFFHSNYYMVNRLFSNNNTKVIDI